MCIGWPAVWKLTFPGARTSWIMPRVRMCLSATISETLFTGPAGTDALSSSKPFGGGALGEDRLQSRIQPSVVIRAGLVVLVAGVGQQLLSIQRMAQTLLNP